MKCTVLCSNIGAQRLLPFQPLGRKVWSRATPIFYQTQNPTNKKDKTGK